MASSDPICPYFCIPSLPVPHSSSHRVWDSPSLHRCEPTPPNTSSFRFPIGEMQPPHHLRLCHPLFHHRPKPLKKQELTVSAAALNTMAYQGPGWDLGSHLKRDPRESVTTGNTPAPGKFYDLTIMFSQPQATPQGLCSSSWRSWGVQMLGPPQSSAQRQLCEPTNLSQDHSGLVIGHLRITNKAGIGLFVLSDL